MSPPASSRHPHNTQHTRSLTTMPQTASAARCWRRCDRLHATRVSGARVCFVLNSRTGHTRAFQSIRRCPEKLDTGCSDLRSVTERRLKPAPLYTLYTYGAQRQHLIMTTSAGASQPPAREVVAECISAHDHTQHTQCTHSAAGADASQPPALEVEAECTYYSPTDDMVMERVRGHCKIH